MNSDLATIAEQFQFEGAFLEASAYGCGHINDTYAARFRKANGSVHRYILQRINHHVFKRPEELMQNIAAVTAHLRSKIVAAGGDADRETLTLIPAVDGKAFIKTVGGDYWRAYIFIEEARTYQVIESPSHVYNGARAFGRFQRLLGDFAAERLYETIPDFHHTRKRFDTFVEAMGRDAVGRVRSVGTEIDFAMQRAGETAILVDMLERGELPRRVTHNDTKFNNVMIDDESGEGVCVIDLDTVMPGSALYDFGDCVRSAANSAAEDERDLSKVFFDLQVFEHLTRGYLDAAGDFLTPAEVALLPFSARLMTFECGMRFLADYLDGDLYFKVHREGHNLDRCRTQFKLVEDMEKASARMQQVIERHRC